MQLVSVAVDSHNVDTGSVADGQRRSGWVQRTRVASFRRCLNATRPLAPIVQRGWVGSDGDGGAWTLGYGALGRSSLEVHSGSRPSPRLMQANLTAPQLCRAPHTSNLPQHRPAAIQHLLGD